MVNTKEITDTVVLKEILYWNSGNKIYFLSPEMSEEERLSLFDKMKEKIENVPYNRREFKGFTKLSNTDIYVGNNDTRSVEWMINRFKSNYTIKRIDIDDKIISEYGMITKKDDIDYLIGKISFFFYKWDKFSVHYKKINNEYKFDFGERDTIDIDMIICMNKIIDECNINVSATIELDTEHSEYDWDSTHATYKIVIAEKEI